MFARFCALHNHVSGADTRGAAGVGGRAGPSKRARRGAVGAAPLQAPEEAAFDPRPSAADLQSLHSLTSNHFN